MVFSGTKALKPQIHASELQLRVTGARLTGRGFRRLACRLFRPKREPEGRYLLGARVKRERERLRYAGRPGRSTHGWGLSTVLFRPHDRVSGCIRAAGFCPGGLRSALAAVQPLLSQFHRAFLPLSQSWSERLQPFLSLSVPSSVFSATICYGLNPKVP